MGYSTGQKVKVINTEFHAGLMGASSRYLGRVGTIEYISTYDNATQQRLSVSFSGKDFDLLWESNVKLFTEETLTPESIITIDNKKYRLEEVKIEPKIGYFAYLKDGSKLLIISIRENTITTINNNGNRFNFYKSNLIFTEEKLEF